VAGHLHLGDDEVARAQRRADGLEAELPAPGAVADAMGGQGGPDP
jgi:hypothetical protein